MIIIEQNFQENQSYTVRKSNILLPVLTFLVTSTIMLIIGCTFGYCLGRKCKKKVNKNHVPQNTDIELEENVAYSVTLP